MKKSDFCSYLFSSPKVVISVSAQTMSENACVPHSFCFKSLAWPNKINLSSLHSRNTLSKVANNLFRAGIIIWRGFEAENRSDLAPKHRNELIFGRRSALHRWRCEIKHMWALYTQGTHSLQSQPTFYERKLSSGVVLMRKSLRFAPKAQK